MQALALTSRRGDGPLWVAAFGLSMLVNLALLVVIGMAALESTEFRKKHQSAAPPPPPPETVAKIFPVPAAGEPKVMLEPAAEKRFARTSPDQTTPPPENTAFIGERDTRATSDRSPTTGAPPLPSQAGIEPRDELDVETTESDYQDGSLSPQSPTSSEPETAVATAEATPQTPAQNTPAQPAASLPPPREALLEGPNPVDVQVPRETAASEEIKPTPDPRPAADSLPPTPPAVAETPKPKSTRDPAFSGFQRKTAVVGSISRTGRSALDVADSPLGRYQSAISRAVEQEWQRNCVRHRDFITPGFLTVRFFVETSGKVRSVQFVGDMETGEVQKGFTLNSIRDAEIPAMPRDLRAQYDDEPLELIFRFYF